MGLFIFLLALGAAEAIAWQAAERLRDRIPQLTLQDVETVRGALRRSYRWTMFDLGVKWRLSEPLADQLTQLARAVLEREMLGEAIPDTTWTEALRSITLAKNLAPGDRDVEEVRRAIAERAEQHSQRNPSK